MSIDYEKTIIAIPLELYFINNVKITKEFMDKYFELYDKKYNGLYGVYTNLHNSGYLNLYEYVELQYPYGSMDSMIAHFGRLLIRYLLEENIIDKQYIIGHHNYFYEILICFNENFKFRHGERSKEFQILSKMEKVKLLIENVDLELEDN